jgi:hypothetical protein
MNRETQEWIRVLEARAFPGIHSARPVAREDAHRFLKRTTLLNEMMRMTCNDYIASVLDRTSKSSPLSLHFLKSFVMLDYPLIVIESLFRPEHISRIRNVQAGILPFNSGREINACAVRAPNGDGVIFFSEWLFSFLWDYYHGVSKLFPPGTPPGLATSVQINAVREARATFRDKLITGKYCNWNISTVLDSENETNSARVYLLFALAFIWAHELGHLFLRHHDETGVSKRAAKLPGGSAPNVDTYALSQRQELDADMFASDIYFKLLYVGLSGFDKVTFTALHSGGFDFFQMLAQIDQERTTKDTVATDTHPPFALRMMYVFLRHEQKLAAHGFAALFPKLRKELASSNLPNYNYNEDFGVDALTIAETP